MKRSGLLIGFLLFLLNSIEAQNVGINASGSAPHASAMLDVDVSSLGATAKKGLLVPRVAISSVTDVSTIPTPTTSLLIYNTTAASSGTNAVFPGYYYWNGTVWVAFAGSGGRDWSLLGNAGTTTGTNFLGTTDNVDLQFKVNSIQGGLINIAGNQTYFGYQAGLVNTGTFNSFFGSQSGKANTTGQLNTAVGYGSMRNLVSGSNNTFLGTNAGANWQTTSGNTAVGWAALQGIGAGTGDYNTAIGCGAGSGATGPNNLSVSTGSYNTYVGYNATSSGAPSTFTNATAIGANAQAGASNVMILGSINTVNGATADTKVGIGITSPSYPLHAITSSAGYAGNFDNSSANNFGLRGRNSAASGTGSGTGVFGETIQSTGGGVRGTNFNSSGTGVVGIGQNAAGGYLVAGSGGAFGATTVGVYGYASGGASAGGGYFINGNGSYAYVGYTTAGNVAQKINGPGAVSTIVKNVKNERVNLYCPESPEVLFQDFGTGTLNKGIAHVELDETFSKNITVNEKHPLRVLIQLEGECKGVFVINKTKTGFDVKELQSGNSNTPFTWFVTANRADAYNEDGTLFSNFEDVRFGEAPGLLESKTPASIPDQKQE